MKWPRRERRRQRDAKARPANSLECPDIQHPREKHSRELSPSVVTSRSEPSRTDRSTVTSVRSTVTSVGVSGTVLSKGVPSHPLRPCHHVSAIRFSPIEPSGHKARRCCGAGFLLVFCEAGTRGALSSDDRHAAPSCHRRPTAHAGPDDRQQHPPSPPAVPTVYGNWQHRTAANIYQ